MLLTILLICGITLLTMSGVTAQEQQDPKNQIQTANQLNSVEQTQNQVQNNQAMAAGPAAGSSTETTKRVSVNSGKQSNSASYHPSITPDGRYVAFDSKATNLVSGVNNGYSNVYVYDGRTGKTIRISRGSGGAQANGDSFNPVITPDGRYVAFYSYAKNLVSGLTNGYSNIFVYDGWTGMMIRVSKGLSGSQANGDSLNPAITPECRYVAFESLASNLVSGDTNGKSDIFVYDGWTGKTIRVSKALNGQANGDTSNPAITPECRYVAFSSFASNLVGGDTNGKSDIFVYDGWTGKTIRVSKALNGQANGNSSHPAITPDCRYVAFESVASNLVSGDTNGKSDVFVYDGWAAKTKRVSIGPGGVQANSGSANPSISADGQRVAFESLASNLVSGDYNCCWDVFVYDGWTSQTYRMSISTAGAQGNGRSADPSISTDGRYVAFDSDSNNLASGDSNGVKDVFVHDRGASASVLPGQGYVDGNGSNMPEYLQPTSNCQSNDYRIIALASSLTQGVFTQYDKAVRIFNWVRDNISYSFYYNTAKGAIGTLTSRTANCCDHSHLLAALARAAGIPARYVHGTCTFSSGTYGHVWNEVYVNGRWYTADSISSRNTFGVINNWNTNTASIHGVYRELPF